MKWNKTKTFVWQNFYVRPEKIKKNEDQSQAENSNKKTEKNIQKFDSNRKNKRKISENNLKNIFVAKCSL